MGIKLHPKLGTTDLEWFESAVNEAKRDAVGFWEIVKQGRYGYCLQGRELDEFVRDYILHLLTAGAVPVEGVRMEQYAVWRHTVRYGEIPVEITNMLIMEWKNLGTDPDVGGVWFAVPRSSIDYLEHDN